MDKENKELTISEVAKKYVVSYSTVYNYCRTGKIQGAIQVVFDNKKKAWRIPEDEAERVFGSETNYAQIQKNAAGDFWTIKEAAEEWNLTENYVRYLCKAHKIPGVIRKGSASGSAWRIPVGTEPPKRKRVHKTPSMNTEDYITISEAAMLTGIKTSAIYARVRRGSIKNVMYQPTSRGIKPRVLISKTELVQDSEMTEEGPGFSLGSYMSIAKASKKWHISVNRIREAAENGLIPAVQTKTKNGKTLWKIPVDCQGVVAALNHENGIDDLGEYMNLVQVAEAMGVTESAIRYRLRCNCFKSLVKAVDANSKTKREQWYVKKEEVERLASERAKRPGWSVKYAAFIWVIPADEIVSMCESGQIANAERDKDTGEWRIPRNTSNPREDIAPGFVSVTQAASVWGVGPSCIRAYCINGRIPGAKKIQAFHTERKVWVIPVELIKKPLSEIVLSIEEMRNKQLRI